MDLSRAEKPTDALAAATALLALVSERELAAIRANASWGTEAHFFFGAAIRNEWLHSNPSLMADFRERGVLHPDDASALLLHVLETFARTGEVDVEGMLASAAAASQRYWNGMRRS